jgi:hypothetical protein
MSTFIIKNISGDTLQLKFSTGLVEILPKRTAIWRGIGQNIELLQEAVDDKILSVHIIDFDLGAQLPEVVTDVDWLKDGF